MKEVDGKLIFSPSDLINFMESRFITWMERYNLEFPGEVKPDEEDKARALFQKKGTEHEIAYLKKLKQEGRAITEISQDENSIKNTKAAILAGKEIVYQAHLKHEKDSVEFAGYADFLFKKKGRSQLGDYYYEPVDTKLARKPKPYFIIQLCAYAEMLESIQGVLPKQLHIVLGDGKVKSFYTNNYYSYYKHLKKLFLSQQDNFNKECMPEFERIENYGRWSNIAKDIIEKQDHLILVANIRTGQIKKLKKAGITTLSQLAQTSLSCIPTMGSKTFLTLKKQAAIQLKSKNKSKPEYMILQPNKEERKRGLSLLPPSSMNDIWLDMEGYPFANGGLEYLFGVAYLDSKGSIAYKDWWAHNTQQEKNAFEKFINWVHARWRKDPTMHIYHYGSYEESTLKRLMGQHGICEDKVDDLLRGQVFVNLYKIVREGLLVGEPAYSLKNIERLYMDKRDGEVGNAADSMVVYEQWLECKDGDDWKCSKTLKKIRDYNELDCRSTKLLADWLRDAQNINNISYISALDSDKEKQQLESKRLNRDTIKSEAAELAQELLNSCENNNEVSLEQIKLTQLLAYLLEFHRREDKPMWWAHFDRLKMSEKELIEDIDCLAGLEHTQNESNLLNQYCYKYDTKQDTKLEVGSSCFALTDNALTLDRVIIKKIDLDQGLIYLNRRLVAQKIHLISTPITLPDTILQAIFDIIKSWQKTGKLPGSINDFLLRKSPKISNNRSGNILHEKEELLEEVSDVVSNLTDSILCMQGPPGSGKTFTAAHVIVELIKKGKTVGVTSNGHKAIAHLIDAVMQKAKEQSVNFTAVKIQSNSKDFHVKSELVKAVKKDRAFNGQVELVGGTAWAFCDKLAESKLDYLFVDEAGQVSIANLFGMSRSTKNIVLMGDQMQLSQPIKGSHPGESGTSCLSYLLQEYQTIPKDLGIFLENTHRLHPKLCQFISEAIYEDRLSPKEVTSKRSLIAPQKNMIPIDSGILFLPVEHEDNSQASEDEVAAIQKLVSDLLKFCYRDEKEKCRNLSYEDILIVAPYNMQVQKIKNAMPDARVGTVDKFQGQEAPIVIYSMCASDLESSSRGIEFLLRKNRINVAISRAQILSIVVGSPNLANAPFKSIEQMELANLYCKLLEHKQIKAT